jgi:hypothetical protein
MREAQMRFADHTRSVKCTGRYLGEGYSLLNWNDTRQRAPVSISDLPG